jgi:cytochrome b6-f complex iron-sulfur subunit
MDRREFLVKAGLVAGGLVLTVSSLRSAAFGASFEDVTVPVPADSPLAKVGGSQIVDTPAGKVIVIHAEKDEFHAFSAKCTHKGARLVYNAEAKRLDCPSHGSQFNGKTGAIVKGPAETSLASYTAKKGTDSVIVAVGP